MGTAKELLLEYLGHITDADRAIELFAEDASIELPYLKSVGMPWQWKGKATIYEFLQNFPQTFSDFHFGKIEVLIETPDQVFAEYHAESRVVPTGRPYIQNYMGRLVSEQGKITLIREALDMVQVAKSLFPKGLQDL